MGLSLLIVVLHYSGLDDTLECLVSLGRQSYGDAHTVVIDNGSADKPGPRIAADHPWVEVIELAENRGWSGGNNAGIGVAIAGNYDVVCLLNNDTVLPDGAVERLMATAAFLGPCILHPAINSYCVDDDVQLDPTIPHPPDLRVTPVARHAGVFEISAVNGACLLVHLAVLKDIGLIDERFFLLCRTPISGGGRSGPVTACSVTCASAYGIRNHDRLAAGENRSRPTTEFATNCCIMKSTNVSGGVSSS